MKKPKIYNSTEAGVNTSIASYIDSVQPSLVAHLRIYPNEVTKLSLMRKNDTNYLYDESCNCCVCKLNQYYSVNIDHN